MKYFFCSYKEHVLRLKMFSAARPLKGQPVEGCSKENLLACFPLPPSVTAPVQVHGQSPVPTAAWNPLWFPTCSDTAQNRVIEITETENNHQGKQKIEVNPEAGICEKLNSYGE